MPALRKLVLPSGTWTWCSGCCNVSIRSPSGKKYVVKTWTVAGFMNPEVFERGQWKKTCDGMITPGLVRKYIEDNLV